jgi:hypothetical protein
VVALSGLAILIAASLICRNQDGCNGSMQRFEVAAGTVPLFFGLLFVLLEAFGLYRIASWFKIIFSFFLLCWMIAVFTVLTFFGTFTTPLNGTNTFYANGYFFCWIGLIAAALAFAEAMKDRARLSDPPNPMVAKSGFLLLVILGSAIELGEGIVYYYNTDATKMSKYAIAVGCVSIGLVVLLYMFMACTHSKYELQDSLYNAMLYVLTIWWAIATFVLTFNNQFWNQAIDNGFFSLYFTTGACLLALSGIWRHDED